MISGFPLHAAKACRASPTAAKRSKLVKSRMLGEEDDTMPPGGKAAKRSLILRYGRIML